jgi:hypothetical protein
MLKSDYTPTELPDYVISRVTTTPDAAALSANGWKFKNPQ